MARECVVASTMVYPLSLDIHVSVRAIRTQISFHVLFSKIMRTWKPCHIPSLGINTGVEVHRVSRASCWASSSQRIHSARFQRHDHKLARDSQSNDSLCSFANAQIDKIGFIVKPVITLEQPAFTTVSAVGFPVIGSSRCDAEYSLVRDP